TMAELDKQFKARTQGAQQAPAPEEVTDLKMQLLNQMINDEILMEMAAAANLSASDSEVDLKFNEFKTQYSEEAFQEQLKAQQMTVDDIKRELRKTQSVEKLVNKEITSKISVSEAEIKEFYDKNKDSFNLPPGYHLLHILVTPVPDGDVKNGKHDDAKTPADAAAKAQKLLHDIQGGQDFAVVAREYSEDANSAPAGGDLNFLTLEAVAQIDPKLGEVVKQLKIGETSPIVQSRYGFHIVKLVEKDPGGQKEYSDARVKAQIHQMIAGRKDQTLKNAFSELARDKAQVTNYLAERVLATAGK
ncbi:MAG TPA: peptidylprolyl isomerase, partial [Terriglobia bacterium]|nr:peptidylprolyl isomerase [Terriglobia bacterium]